MHLHVQLHVHLPMCLTHVPVGILFKFAIVTILQRFQNKK